MTNDLSRPTGVSLARVAAVTGSLAVLGATAGAVVALAIIGALGLLLEPRLLTLGSLAGAAGFGALVGGVFGPVLAWTLLRSVPIGRAVVETAVGGAIGAAVALAIPVSGPVPLLAIAGAGALAAAIRLRIAFQRKARASGGGA